MIENIKKSKNNPDLALTHDFLNQYGGAERALYFFTRIFPDAPIYTSIYFPESTFDSFKKSKIFVSFMQKIPGINKNYKKYLVFYPFAFKKFNLREYRIIISSSSAFSSFIRKKKNEILICYCYTPPRFLWSSDRYLEGEKISKVENIVLAPILKILRKMDIKNSDNVDYYISISKNISERIKSIYSRDSIVIYPPIELDKYIYSDKKENFFLMVSRLKGYKKIDLAIKAFNITGQRLLIVGTGEDENSLKGIANQNIEFLGRVSEQKLLQLYSKARALVFTGEEDFGLVPLESQASGTPVIAYGKGGALETIVEGKTGFFFRQKDEKSLIDSLKKFDDVFINPEECRKNAERFDFKYFREDILNFIDKVQKKEI